MREAGDELLWRVPKEPLLTLPVVVLLREVAVPDELLLLPRVPLFRAPPNEPPLAGREVAGALPVVAGALFCADLLPAEFALLFPLKVPPDAALRAVVVPPLVTPAGLVVVGVLNVPPERLLPNLLPFGRVTVPLLLPGRVLPGVPTVGRLLAPTL